MQQNRERARVGGEDYQLADAAVQRFGGLVGALLQLPVVGGLLNKILVSKLVVRSLGAAAFQQLTRISWERAWSACGHAAELSSVMESTWTCDFGMRLGYEGWWMKTRRFTA